MRTYIENRISEAVMRKCHKCGKRFVKETGCNKMTCVCGANSCYACRAEDIDYNHFNNNKKCANTDPNAIHQRDMEDAADKAKAQYLLDHPEAKDIELKTDFKDMIKNVKPKKGRRNGRNTPYPRHLPRYDYYDEGDDDDDDGDIDDEDDVDIDGGGGDDDDDEGDDDDVDGDVDDDDTDDDDIVNDVGDILKAFLY
ncbi:unnamed protein product [Lymnaea stagnalis]|uniref:Uncharacterized protein n=1 Tax=Lymnaea stagnalis TaxID=6523 RepID=A0AAV2I5R2_LYMST